jgi:hypothetical protein
LFQTLVDGKSVHGAGFAVGAGVGLLVGAAVGFEVGAVVGLAVGTLVGAPVGAVVGALVGTVVGLGVRPGLPVARGPLPVPLAPVPATGATSRSVGAVDVADPEMAVGPATARVVEPAIDESGPPIVAPVGVAPRLACEAASTPATTTSASEDIARGARRSMPGSSSALGRLSMAKSSGGPAAAGAPGSRCVRESSGWRPLTDGR